jgi:hypothetical protein
MRPRSLVRPAMLVMALVFAGHVASAQEPAPATAAAQPAPATTAVNEALTYSNKWRLKVNEGSNNDGIAKFRVTPKGQAATDITVEIRKGRSENGVARDVKDAFKSALDPKRFHVEGDDFEDVLVKKKGGPDFALEVIESTLKGTHFKLHRE